MVRALRSRDPKHPDCFDGLLQPDLSLWRREFRRRRARGRGRRRHHCRPAAGGGRGTEPSGARAGLDVIRLATPTSDRVSPPRIVEHASGFIYYVAIAGITGTRSADAAACATAVARLRRFTPLPIAVGFGIKNPAASCRGRASGRRRGGRLVARPSPRRQSRPRGPRQAGSCRRRARRCPRFGRGGARGAGAVIRR